MRIGKRPMKCVHGAKKQPSMYVASTRRKAVTPWWRSSVNPMCGIAGIIRFDGAPVQPEDLKRMTDAQFHRGPDGEGTWADGSVGLGHRRLAIIDLSDAGSQPMSGPNGEVLVYNGEV